MTISSICSRCLLVSPLRLCFYKLNRLNMSTKTRSTVKNSDYVLNLVRKFDYENFLATLLIKDPVIKRCALAFRAFNVELSQVLDVTSQPVAVQGRYLFWSEVVEEIYSGDVHKNVKNQPIAAEILEVSLTHFRLFADNYSQCVQATNGGVSKRHLKRLISCRNSPEHLTSFPFETVQQLQDYCESSIAPVYYLLVESAISRREKLTENLHLKLDHVASHLAKSQGVSNVLRGVAHNARSGRCYISSDLLSKHRSSHQDFMKYRSKKEVLDISYDLATIANDHLTIAKNLLKDSQVKQFLPVFLPIILVEMYLKKLEQCNFDIFHQNLYQRDGILPLKLWFKSLKMKLV